MHNNNDDIENRNQPKDRECYSDAPGTGIWASMIFVTVTTVAMYILAKFMGN